jgi:hypothetical protein
MEEGDDLYDKLVIGLIADEVEEIYPRAASHDQDGTPIGWNANVLIPAMIYLIQKLHDEDENLKTRISQLENAI